MSENRKFLPPAASDVIFIGAIAAIFQGDVDTGIANIITLADEGYERAAASYAQLLAYQGNWEEVGEYAGLFLTNPACGSAHDMYLEMWRVLVLASMQTSNWQQALDVVAQAKPIYTNAFNNKKHPRLKYLNTFSKFIQGDGKGELPYQTFPASAIDEAVSEELFQGLKQYHLERGNDARAWPDKILLEWAPRQDLYTAAMDYKLEGQTVSLYKLGKAPPEGYNQLLFLAKSLLLSGAKKEAREMLEKAVTAYTPSDLADVLPVGALWDENCHQLIPLLRTDDVLRTKRKMPVKSFHRIPADKISAIESKKEHLLHLARQASMADIERWEEQMAGDARNIELRTLLIISYHTRIEQYTHCAGRHAEHVFWMINHAPHTVFAGDRHCMLINRGQSAYYKQGKELWLKTLRRSGTTTQAALNAAQYLRYDVMG